MRKTLSSPVFLLAVLLATVNQILEKGFGIFIPVIHSYLDDLLCFPIVLTLGLAAYRYFWPNYRLKLWHVWPLVLVYSVYFEMYLPQISSVYTSDILDVVMYISGAVIFQRFINGSRPDLSATSLQNS